MLPPSFVKASDPPLVLVIAPEYVAAAVPVSRPRYAPAVHETGPPWLPVPLIRAASDPTPEVPLLIWPALPKYTAKVVPPFTVIVPVGGIEPVVPNSNMPPVMFVPPL